MKRLWLGVGVIVALICCGAWVSVRAQNVHGSIRMQLEQATVAALREDWPAVSAMTEQICRRWEQHLSFSAAVSHHEQLDEVEAGLARLEVYLTRQQAEAYGAQSAALARRVAALEEEHRLSWRNLL